MGKRETRRKGDAQGIPQEPVPETVFARVERTTGVHIPLDDLPPVVREAIETSFERLDILHNTDRLTGLATSASFTKELERVFTERAYNGFSGHESEPATLIFCDLNKFKSINDQLGYENTNYLLRNVAGVIQKYFAREGVDFVARYNDTRGDEFVILIEGLNTQQADRQMQNALAELDRTIFQCPNNDNEMKHVQVRMTHATHNLDEADSGLGAGGKRAKGKATNVMLKAREVLKQAEESMKRSKKSGDKAEERKSRLLEEPEIQALAGQKKTVVAVDTTPVPLDLTWNDYEQQRLALRARAPRMD